MLYKIELSKILCFGLYIGTLAHWHIGTLAHWHIGTFTP